MVMVPPAACNPNGTRTRRLNPIAWMVRIGRTGRTTTAVAGRIRRALTITCALLLATTNNDIADASINIFPYFFIVMFDLFFHYDDTEKRGFKKH
jgi:hypothetical protein